MKKSNKILFLDHDGVICLSNNWGSRYKKQNKWGGRKLSMTPSEIPVEYRFDNFDKKAIKVLNSILEETNAEIVVSSDWRFHATLEEMGEYYEQQGIIKKPISFTKNLSNSTSPDKLEEFRANEITNWLSENPEVTHWVAVDDLDMRKFFENSVFGMAERDWGLINFVWTPINGQGIKQTGIKEKIIKFLKND